MSITPNNSPSIARTNPTPSPAQPEPSGLWARIKAAVTSTVAKVTSTVEKKGVDAAVSFARKVESTGVFSKGAQALSTAKTAARVVTDIGSATAEAARDITVYAALTAETVLDTAVDVADVAIDVGKKAAKGVAKRAVKTADIAKLAFNRTRRIVSHPNTPKFFLEGKIGKAIMASTMWIGLDLVGSPAIGGKMGAQIFSSRVRALAATLCGVVAFDKFINSAEPNKKSKSSKKAYMKRLMLAVGPIFVISGVLTMLATVKQYANATEAERAGNTLDAYCAHLGYQIGALMMSSLLISASSGLPVKKSIQNNLQCVIAISALGALSNTNAVSLLPLYQTIAGMAAYNADSIQSLFSRIQRMRNSERVDLAQKIKNYLMPREENSLAAAIRARADAEEKDLAVHDTNIRNIRTRSVIMTALFNSLDQIFRVVFTKFNAYQEILTGSSVAAAQLKFQDEFTRISFQAARLEEELGGHNNVELLDEDNFELISEELDIERTSDYQEIADEGSRRRALADPASFIEARRKYYKEQKNLAKTKFENILYNATTPDTLMGRTKGNAKALAAGKIFSTFIAPELAKIPEIRDLETTMLGFPITTPVDAAIAKELIEMHLKSFLAFNLMPIVSVVVSALSGEATYAALDQFLSFIPKFLRPNLASSEPLAQTPLSKEEEFQLIDGLLNLVLNHYDRTCPNSTIVDMSKKTVRAATTYLSRGREAAISEYHEDATVGGEGVNLGSEEDRNFGIRAIEDIEDSALGSTPEFASSDASLSSASSDDESDHALTPTNELSLADELAAADALASDDVDLGSYTDHGLTAEELVEATKQPAPQTSRQKVGEFFSRLFTR